MPFDHVGVLVSDLDATVGFARDVLGLGEPASRFEAPEHGLSGGFFALGTGRLELLRFEEPGERLPEGEVARLDHFEVVVDDLEAEATRLSARGVGFQGPLLSDPVDVPIEMRGRRHLWTRPETSGG